MKTLIFLCNDNSEIDIRKNIEDAKKQIASEEFYDTTWSSGNSTKIKVGDRAYLKRTGSKPHGFFAAGKVVAVTSALNSPKGHCWTGCEMLSQFELKPIQYMARLRPIFKVE